MKPNANTIGQDRPVKDPEDAMKSADGVYTDPVDSVPLEDRYAMKIYPQGPDPVPFSIRNR